MSARAREVDRGRNVPSPPAPVAHWRRGRRRPREHGLHILSTAPRPREEESEALGRSRWTLRTADGRPSSSARGRTEPAARTKEAGEPAAREYSVACVEREGSGLAIWCRGGRSGSRSSPAAGPGSGLMDGIRSAIRPALSLWRWLAGWARTRRPEGREGIIKESKTLRGLADVSYWSLSSVQCRRRTTAGGCWRSATDGELGATGERPGPIHLGPALPVVKYQ